MKQRIERLDARYCDAGFLSKLDGRSKVRLDLHWPSRSVILIHRAVGLGRNKHLLDRCFPEAGSEAAALDCCNVEEFVDDSSDKRTDADLLEELGMGWRLENDAGRVKSNGSVASN